LFVFYALGHSKEEGGGCEGRHASHGQSLSFPTCLKNNCILECFNLPTEFLNQSASVIFGCFLGILALSYYLQSGFVVHAANHSELDKAELILVRVSKTYNRSCDGCGILCLDRGILLRNVTKSVLCSFQ